MTALAIASMFTGVVIFVWGLRALRNGRAKIIYFTMRSWMSTMIFGIVSMLCGILMIIAGPAATAPLTAELADLMAKVSLILFGVGWVIALFAEALARISLKLFPEESSSLERRRKRKPAASTAAAADTPARARSSASSRIFRKARNRFLTSGSQLYARIFSPYQPRHLQEQWRAADVEREKRKRLASATKAATDQEALPPETRGAEGEFDAPNAAQGP